MNSEKWNKIKLRITIQTKVTGHKGPAGKVMPTFMRNVSKGKFVTAGNE